MSQAAKLVGNPKAIVQSTPVWAYLLPGVSMTLHWIARGVSYRVIYKRRVQLKQVREAPKAFGDD